MNYKNIQPERRQMRKMKQRTRQIENSKMVDLNFTRLLVILNVHSLNTLIKRQKKRKIQQYGAYKKCTLNVKIHRLKIKEFEKNIPC